LFYNEILNILRATPENLHLEREKNNPVKLQLFKKLPVPLQYKNKQHWEFYKGIVNPQIKINVETVIYCTGIEYRYIPGAEKVELSNQVNIINRTLILSF
jgi:hypothetical protein